MFFKKQVDDGIPKWGPETDVGWDDKTVKQIADSNQLNVRLTHMSQTISLGQMRAGDDAMPRDPEWSIRGATDRVDHRIGTCEGINFPGVECEEPMRTTGVRTKKNLTKQQTNKDQEFYLLYLFLDRRSALKQAKP
jgi:hypothetical protein